MNKDTDQNESSISEGYLNNFKPEISKMKKLIREVDDLYGEVKIKYDEVSNSHTKGSLTFISNQTSNLVSLKNAKLSIIKEILAIKKSAIDLDNRYNRDDKSDISEANARAVNYLLNEMDKSNSESQSLDEYSDIAEDINDFNEENIEMEDINEFDDDNQTLNDIVDRLEREGKIQFSDNDLSMKYEKQKPKIVIYLPNDDIDNWEFLAINKDYEVIPDYPLPNKNIYQMDIKKDKSGEYSAKDQYNREYEVVG